MMMIEFKNDGVRTGAKNCAQHQCHLVHDKPPRNTVIHFDDIPRVQQQIEDVRDGRRHPATALIEKLVETLRRVGPGVRGGAVLHTVSALQDQRAQPPVLALVKLHVVEGLLGLHGVPAHHVVVHEGLGAEQTEAAGAAHHASQHVLRRFLQPMSQCVLESLIPDHDTCKKQCVIQSHDTKDVQWFKYD